MKKYLKAQISQLKPLAQFCLSYGPVCIVIVLFMIIPMVDVVKQAFTTQDPYDYTRQQQSFQNFEDVFNDVRFREATTNTLLLVFVVSPLLIMLFFTIAFAITKLSHRLFKNVVIGLIFTQLFVSSYSIGISFLVLFSTRSNVLNTLFATSLNWNDPNDKTLPFLRLVIFYAWTMSVISILLFTIGINKITRNQFFMARIDNLSLWKQIWYVYLPHLKRTVFIQLYIFVFQALFFYPTIYENPYVLNSQTLATYIVDNLHTQSTPANWNRAAAASLLLFATIFVAIGISFITRWSALYFRRRYEHANVKAKP